MKKNELKFNGLLLAHLLDAGRTQLRKAGKQARGYVGNLTGVTILPERRQIEVKQLGLATGVVVPVRVIKRVHIPVKYIPSE